MTKGMRIKTKRETLKISQTELAQKIGVSKQTLYKYEHDIVTNIPSDVIEKLSDQLNCTPEYIMGWHEADDTSPDTEKALQLYELYKNAIPQVQEAVDVLLKQSQSDS